MFSKFQPRIKDNGRRTSAYCGKLLDHDEKIAFCNTDLLIAMSIQSGFPGRDTLQLRKTG